MRVLMIAPPGAGKGTQGAQIAAHFGIPHLATGDMLRDQVARRTALGRAVQEYLDRGELVPDQVVLDMLREAMVAAKAAGGGFVLDGIPRNMQQARAAYLIGRELGMTRGCGAAPAGRRCGTHASAACASSARTSLRRHRRHHCPAPGPLSCGDIPHCLVVRDRGILVSVDAMRSADQVGREILHRPRSDAPALGPCARAGTGPR